MARILVGVSRKLSSIVKPCTEREKTAEMRWEISSIRMSTCSFLCI
jgi:hypothetical protein